MKKSSSAFSLIELSIVILIIGIIIAGITQGSRLVTKMRVASARALTQSSPVTSIKGLMMWLETTMDGNVVSSTNGTNPDDDDKVSIIHVNEPWGRANSTIGQSFFYPVISE